MTFEAFVAFALLNFTYSLAPGPNAALILGSSARHGISAGAAIIAGILVAEVLWAALAMAIVVGLMDLSSIRPELLQLVGAVALVVIGLAMIVKRAVLLQRTVDGEVPADHRHAVLKGGLVGITNPLALIFFISIAPSFMLPDQVTLQGVAMFTLAAVLSCAAAHLPYLGAAGLRRGTLSVTLERACGLMLCALGGSSALASIGAFA